MKDEYYSWPTEVLVKYVVKKHHDAMSKILSGIKSDLNQLVLLQGDRYPELFDIQHLFSFFSWQINAHLSKEAITVLPFAKRYTEELKKQRFLRKPGLYSACPSVHKMYNEHKIERKRFELLFHFMETTSIAQSGSLLYEKICNNLQSLRRQWEDQVRLENDIIFPRIIEMESVLFKQ